MKSIKKTCNLLIFLVSGVLLFHCGAPTKPGEKAYQTAQESPMGAAPSSQPKDVTPRDSQSERCRVNITVIFEGVGDAGPQSYDSTFKKYKIWVRPPPYNTERDTYPAAIVNMELIGCDCAEEDIEWSTGDTGKTTFVALTRASDNNSIITISVRCQGNLIASIDFIIRY